MRYVLEKWRCGIGLFFLMAAMQSVAAEQNKTWPAPAEDVETFLQETAAHAMEAGQVPGTEIAVVYDGQIVCCKGYGSARLGEADPVDPAVTLFRVASISKLFTTTAVMQLMEQGRLDPYADVNKYLHTFQIPSTYPEPVTVAHLLTHTAGFDDRFLGMGAPSPEALPPLGDYLARRMPPRVMPPGQVISYSNHGMALAGYVLETVSGEPFADYIRIHIFEPLGMQHSAFDLVPDDETRIAQGYMFYLGKNHPVRYDYPCTPPASSLATTAEDMARFMIAHLQQGRYGEARILSEAASRRMTQQQFTHHPGLPGMAYGFEERYFHGRRILQHTGLIWGFASILLLIPEEKTGLFVTANSDTRLFYETVSSRFLERFFPAGQPEPAPLKKPEGSRDRLASAAGFYRNNRYCRSDIFKVSTAFPGFVNEVYAGPGAEEGVLRLRYIEPGLRTTVLHEIEPGYFRRINNGPPPSLADAPRAAFRNDASGAVTHLCLGDSAYERIAWSESRLVLAPGLAASLLVMLLWLGGRAIAAWRRRTIPGLFPPLACRLATAACGLNGGFVAGFVLFLATLDPQIMGYGPPPILSMLLGLPLLSAVLTVLLTLSWAAGLIQRRFSRGMAVSLTLVLLAAWTFLFLLRYWNLLGYHFG